MNNELISVIMPAYNAQKFISDAVESVLNQNYKNIELIIINDGSVDNTQSIIESLQEKDNRIKILQQKNSKQGKARNAGMSMANGEWVAFIDADDIWFNNKLETQINIIKETGVDLVFCNVAIINENNEVIKNSIGVTEKRYQGKQGILEFLKGNKIPLLSVLAKKSSVLSVNGFPESKQLQYGEDYFLWLRMLINGSVFISQKENLGAYRISSQQSSKKRKNPEEYLEQLANLSFQDEELSVERDKALRIWIKRFVQRSEISNRAHLKKVLSFHPSEYKKKSLLFVNSFLPINLTRKLSAKW